MRSLALMLSVALVRRTNFGVSGLPLPGSCQPSGRRQEGSAGDCLPSSRPMPATPTCRGAKSPFRGAQAADRGSRSLPMRLLGRPEAWACPATKDMEQEGKVLRYTSGITCVSRSGSKLLRVAGIGDGEGRERLLPSRAVGLPDSALHSGIAGSAVTRATTSGVGVACHLLGSSATFPGCRGSGAWHGRQDT